jgi:hypothetical protein
MLNVDGVLAQQTSRALCTRNIRMSGPFHFALSYHNQPQGTRSFHSLSQILLLVAKRWVRRISEYPKGARLEGAHHSIRFLITRRPRDVIVDLPLLRQTC